MSGFKNLTRTKQTFLLEQTFLLTFLLHLSMSLRLRRVPLLQVVMKFNYPEIELGEL